MAYFTAVLVPDGGGWRAVDVDVQAGSPEELGDVLRGAADEDGGEAVAVLEREDEWFALVRAGGDGRGEDDVRVFVSDAVAAGSSRFAELFAELPAADAGLRRPGPAGAEEPDEPADLDDGDGGDEGADDGAGDEPDVADLAAPAVPEEDVWAGDPHLLEDLGCPAPVLLRLSASGADPAEATAEVGELLGFADVLESLR
ncbi:tRNA adenosine deaminase-associated protein [Kineococcus terrestris]|uniref:tRNA adenosine deaminase-associated protein n=1 Tax=Kineococcus terrestris TaxID=2044856 RepID=UPI0034DB1AC1